MTADPEHAQKHIFRAIIDLQARDVQNLGREWLNQATGLAGANLTVRIAASKKLAGLPLETRLSIERRAKTAVHHFGNSPAADPVRSLAVSAVAETALALEAKELITAEEFTCLTGPWVEAFGPVLITRPTTTPTTGA
jgi:hypothetical protein